VRVKVVGDSFGLALVLQPDQRDIVILHQTARARATGSGGSNGKGSGVGPSVRQSRNQIGEVARLIRFHRINWRLSVFGSYDEQRLIKEILTFECLNHVGEGFVGFAQTICKDPAWGARSV